MKDFSIYFYLVNALIPIILLFNYADTSGNLSNLYFIPINYFVALEIIYTIKFAKKLYQYSNDIHVIEQYKFNPEEYIILLKNGIIENQNIYLWTKVLKDFNPKNKLEELVELLNEIMHTTFKDEKIFEIIDNNLSNINELEHFSNTNKEKIIKYILKYSSKIDLVEKCAVKLIEDENMRQTIDKPIVTLFGRNTDFNKLERHYTNQKEIYNSILENVNIGNTKKMILFKLAFSNKFSYNFYLQLIFENLKDFSTYADFIELLNYYKYFSALSIDNQKRSFSIIDENRKGIYFKLNIEIEGKKIILPMFENVEIEELIYIKKDRIAEYLENKDLSDEEKKAYSRELIFFIEHKGEEYAKELKSKFDIISKNYDKNEKLRILYYIGELLRSYEKLEIKQFNIKNNKKLFDTLYAQCETVEELYILNNIVINLNKQYKINNLDYYINLINVRYDGFYRNTKLSENQLAKYVNSIAIYIYIAKRNFPKMSWFYKEYDAYKVHFEEEFGEKEFNESLLKQLNKVIYNTQIKDYQRFIKDEVFNNVSSNTSSNPSFDINFKSIRAILFNDNIAEYNLLKLSFYKKYNSFLDSLDDMNVINDVESVSRFIENKNVPIKGKDLNKFLKASEKRKKKIKKNALKADKELKKNIKSSD